MRPRLKGLLFRVAAACLAALALVLVLEVVLRFLPVHEGLATRSVTADDPILRFRPNRDAWYSKGWRMSLANRVHVNNAGYVSDLDYESVGPRPLIAVVGDSYVEAAMVPWEATAPARLSERTRGRVYAFGVSGAPLSQYLAQAADVRDRYRPDAFVFVVVGNDFDESLAAYNAVPGFHVFEEGPDGALRLRLNEMRVGLARRVARRSRLAMYLIANLDLLGAPRRVAARDGGTYVANTSAAADAERVAASRRAVDAFLARLPGATGLSPDRTVLAFDGIRPQLYDDAALAGVADSYVARMRTYAIERARAAGFECVDLQPRFRARHAETGERFEFVEDAHWNAAGHAVLADAVAESSTWQAVHVASPP